MRLDSMQTVMCVCVCAARPYKSLALLTRLYRLVTLAGFKSTHLDCPIACLFKQSPETVAISNPSVSHLGLKPNFSFVINCRFRPDHATLTGCDTGVLLRTCAAAGAVLRAHATLVTFWGTHATLMLLWEPLRHWCLKTHAKIGVLLEDLCNVDVLLRTHATLVSFKTHAS